MSKGETTAYKWPDWFEFDGDSNGEAFVQECREKLEPIFAAHETALTPELLLDLAKWCADLMDAVY